MTPTIQPLRLIGRYLLCDAIASGGMATVHLARLVGQERFTRTVAVKQLYPHFARDEDFVAMFLDEARLLARIRHPNVVAPLDIVVLDSELFIVMEYVHGDSLARLLSEHGGPVLPRIASAVLGQVLLGLHAAHEATSETGQRLELVHRDVSPQNILIGEDGVARIVDFGIAKAASRAHITREGRLKGKLGYMAPEQLRSRSADRRTDLFTSGIVLWETLTGKRLYDAESPAEAVEKILNSQVPAPSSLVPGLSPELDRLVLRALAMDPADRFQSAREMARELDAAVPAAGVLEVSAWVEQHVGAELQRRAERIAELEAISIGELTLEQPRTAENREPRILPNPPAPLPVLINAAPVTGGTDLSIVPSSGDHVVPGRSRRRVVLAIGIAALLVLSIATLRFRDHSAGPGVELTLASAHSGTRSAPESSATGLGRAQASPPQLPLEPAPPPPSEAPELGSAALTEPGTPNAPRPAPGARAAKPVSAAAAAPQPVLPSTPSPARPRSNNKNCEVLYTLDEHGVKRFKPECF